MKRGKKLFKAGVVLSLCAAMSVSVLPKQISAKTKFSVPKTTVISYDKGNSGANDWFTNVIWINGTSSWKTAGKVERGMKSFKSSKKKVVSKMAPVYTETRKDQKVGLGVRVKRTGTSTVTFKIKYKGKTYKRKTKVKVIKYQNPFQKIMIDG